MGNAGGIVTPEDVQNIRDRLTIAERGAAESWGRREDGLGAKYDREAEMWRRILAALTIARTRGVALPSADAGEKPCTYTNAELKRLHPEVRLLRIASIIEGVDNRCAAADGPVTPTLEEMRQEELSAIYALSIGRNP